MEAEELIAAIVADPEDRAAWMVYADWLLERGHPRGELIQLGPVAAAGDNAAKWRIRQLEADEGVLVSPRLRERARQWRFAFDRGFVTLAEFQRHAEPRVDAEALRALCADPHAGLLQTVMLDIFEYLDDEDEVTGTTRRAYARADVGDLDTELARLRWLREVRLHGVACTALAHRSLQHLTTDSITCADARIDLPALETLDWHAMSAAAGFGTMLRAPLPRLRSLGIARGYAAMVAELAMHPVARQLASLSIQTNELAAILTLVENAAAFPDLRQLSVRGIHEDLEHAEVDRLREALTRAYPTTEIYVPWRALLPDPPEVLEERSTAAPEVDDQSRRPDGTLDAIGRWNRGD